MDYTVYSFYLILLLGFELVGPNLAVCENLTLPGDAYQTIGFTPPNPCCERKLDLYVRFCLIRQVKQLCFIISTYFSFTCRKMRMLLLFWRMRTHIL